MVSVYCECLRYGGVECVFRVGISNVWVFCMYHECVSCVCIVCVWLSVCVVYVYRVCVCIVCNM